MDDDKENQSSHCNASLFDTFTALEFEKPLHSERVVTNDKSFTVNKPFQSNYLQE
jgi:hypothetical protein